MPSTVGAGWDEGTMDQERMVKRRAAVHRVDDALADLRDRRRSGRPRSRMSSQRRRLSAEAIRRQGPSSRPWYRSPAYDQGLMGARATVLVGSKAGDEGRNEREQ